jgi:hypothetical protein
LEPGSQWVRYCSASKNGLRHTSQELLWSLVRQKNGGILNASSSSVSAAETYSRPFVSSKEKPRWVGLPRFL